MVLRRCRQDSEDHLKTFDRPPGTLRICTLQRPQRAPEGFQLVPVSGALSRLVYKWCSDWLEILRSAGESRLKAFCSEHARCPIYNERNFEIMQCGNCRSNITFLNANIQSLGLSILHGLIASSPPTQT